jgi:hypothetical protein
MQGLAESREESVSVTLLAGKTWTSGSSYLFSCEAVSLKGMGIHGEIGRNRVLKSLLRPST